MTYEQAASSIAERFSGAGVETGTPLTVAVAPDQWRSLAQFAKESLGCRFFNFLSAVDGEANATSFLERPPCHLRGGA